MTFLYLVTSLQTNTTFLILQIYNFQCCSIFAIQPIQIPSSSPFAKSLVADKRCCSSVESNVVRTNKAWPSFLGLCFRLSSRGAPLNSHRLLSRCYYQPLVFAINSRRECAAGQWNAEESRQNAPGGLDDGTARWSRGSLRLTKSSFQPDSHTLGVHGSVTELNRDRPKW